MNILRPATEAFPVIDQLLQERLGRTSSRPDSPTVRSTLTELLYRRYPRLYGERHLSTRQSVMPFGFEHDDGWFVIIDVLSGLLEQRDVLATQVKEKFATLDYYFRGDGGSSQGAWLSLGNSVAASANTQGDAGAT